MPAAVSRRTLCWTWRSFEPRHGRHIERQLREGAAPCCPACGCPACGCPACGCPACGAVLEARPNTRLTRALPRGAMGYDLDCRDCRRFRCIVRHTARSLRLLRIRRLVAAVRAA